MSEKIDATLKSLAAATQSGKTTQTNPPASESPPQNLASDLPGDPNCPHCRGLGYLAHDLPVGHPDFGKLQVCTCRHGQISQQIHARFFALSNLDELTHLTFENFLPRGRVGLRQLQADTLEAAYNQARLFAQSLNGWLLIQGYYGTGKTHLAAAVANFAVSMGVPTLFLTVPDLLDTLRFTYNDPAATFESRFEEIRTAPLLVMDDFGTHNATSWAQEKLFQIINYRYINHLPLVITTNLLLSEIEGRIRSRLEDPELVTRVHIRAPDYSRPVVDTSESDLSTLDRYYQQTFATFDLRRGEGLAPEHLTSLERAYQAARQFAEDPHGWLVLTGGFRCGKTHLAAAIANNLYDLGQEVLFTHVPALLDHLRATFNPNSPVSLDRIFESVRTVGLLILDDLGTQSMSPWVREKLYQLFNYRYTTELPAVVTTVEFKDEMDPRVRSRLEDPRLSQIIAITAPPYRGTPSRSGRRKT